MTTDLSKFHQPIGDLLASSLSREEYDQYKLSDAQVEQFQEQGFLGGVRILDDTQIEALKGELADLVVPNHDGAELWYEYHSNESTDPSAILFHALGAWRLRPNLHDILWHPAFLVPASQLLNGSVRFWHDQLFCKPAGHGGVVAWHQDYSYWTRTVPLAHLTCWMGLDDSTIENGCVNYVPGSHRWPLLPRTELAGGVEAIKALLTDEQQEQFHPVPCELKKGEASFHHPLTLHGSYKNSSDRPRRAVVLNVFRDGVVSDQDEPLLDGVDAVPRGQPMSGQFFPLLFEVS